MGRSATGEPKEKVLRVRISDKLDERIVKVMKDFRWTGQKDNFTAYLVERGIDLVDYELARNAHSVQTYAADVGREYTSGYRPLNQIQAGGECADVKENA